jgi:uncharacterized protein (TIGR01777 family)
MAGRLDPTHLEGIDAVVNLAGENIGQRWSAETRTQIRESRVRGTRLLAEALAGRTTAPRILINASAVGYYGDRDDEELDESSSNGTGFLAGVCRDWEAATRPAADAGVRTVLMRSGIVLSADGGALTRMLTPFRFGVGGRLGSGRQWTSWISLDDMVRAIRFAMRDARVSGPINVVAPNPVTNADFATALGAALHRPAMLPVPAFALRAVFGEMADETLLASQRARPRALLASGFEFAQPTVDSALRQAVGRSSASG